MKIVTTFSVKQEIVAEWIAKFNGVEFLVFPNMKEALGVLPFADVLVTYGEDLTDELVEMAKQLRWVMVVSAGMDKMPFQALQSRGILVTNARGIHKVPMAEYTIGMMLQVARQAKVIWKHEEKRKWDRSVRMQELRGGTIGIIGVGAIGGEIARLAKAFSMKTIGVSRSGKAVPYVDEVYNLSGLDALMGQADFVVSVLPSTKETRGILTYQQFLLMKKNAIFINIGRGDTVVEEDLVKALREDLFSHAVLDVFKEEPLPSESVFWGMENVTVTPHLSGISKHYLPRAYEIFVENLNVFLADGIEYTNRIDLERGY